MSILRDEYEQSACYLFTVPQDCSLDVLQATTCRATPLAWITLQHFMQESHVSMAYVLSTYKLFSSKAKSHEGTPGMSAFAA